MVTAITPKEITTIEYRMPEPTGLKYKYVVQGAKQANQINYTCDSNLLFFARANDDWRQLVTTSNTPVACRNYVRLNAKYPPYNLKKLLTYYKEP